MITDIKTCYNSVETMLNFFNTMFDNCEEFTSKQYEEKRHKYSVNNNMMKTPYKYNRNTAPSALSTMVSHGFINKVREEHYVYNDKVDKYIFAGKLFDNWYDFYRAYPEQARNNSNVYETQIIIPVEKARYIYKINWEVVAAYWGRTETN